MTDKESKIKSMIKSRIANIKELGSNFVRYKAKSIKKLLENILEYIENKEQECKNLKEELRYRRRSIKDISIKSTEICKILEKYKQALDEIEEFIKSQLDDFGNDVYSMDKSSINNIQNIIDKANTAS